MFTLANIYAGIAEVDLKNLVRTSNVICDLGRPDSVGSRVYTPAFTSPYSIVLDYLAHSGCLNIKEAVKNVKEEMTDEDKFKVNFFALPCVNAHVIHMVAACMHTHQTNMRFRNRCRRKTGIEIREHLENMWISTRNLILAFPPALITDKGRSSFNISPE